MARPAKKAAVPSKGTGTGPEAAVASQFERPPEPKRYEASKDELLQFYREMLLIRRFEERAGQLYGSA